MSHEVKQLLQRLGLWLKKHHRRFLKGLNPGASPEQLNGLGKALGAKVPEELRELLAWHNGQELKMPTPHDEFSPRAHRGAGRGVSAQARRNAACLDQVMRAEGFRPNPNEWWHFDAPGARRYPLLDVPVR